MNRFSIKLCVFALCLNARNVVSASAPVANMPIISRETKNNLPEDLLAEAQKTSLSILKPKDADRAVLYKNYPDGSVLFPKNSDIASKFNVMVKAIQANPDLIEFFRKIHMNSLNQLYIYLMKIYTNFNLTNPGASDDPAATTPDVTAYLTNEASYATNKKKLILNHFINIIQSQFAASIVSYAPATPSDFAVTLGKIFVHNDCGIDLTPFAQPQTDPKIIASQAPFMNFLQQYMAFFQAYTSTLSTIDANGVNQYYTIAQGIQKYLYPQGVPTSNLAAASTSDATATPVPDPALTKTNPTMFFYDIESMRSIQFIPFVAGTVPTNSQLIPWAPSIVNAATKNTTVNGHAVAFFTDIANKTTTNQTQAKHLYMLTEVGPTLFQQELLAQPAWMNTQDGSIRILRACLGDFSVLVGLGILDSETEAIIQKALALGTSAPKK